MLGYSSIAVVICVLCAISVLINCIIQKMSVRRIKKEAATAKIFADLVDIGIDYCNPALDEDKSKYPAMSKHIQNNILAIMNALSNIREASKLLRFKPVRLNRALSLDLSKELCESPESELGEIMRRQAKSIRAMYKAIHPVRYRLSALMGYGHLVVLLLRYAFIKILNNPSKAEQRTSPVVMREIARSNPAEGVFANT